MKIIKNSIRQMLRTPVRTALFLSLIALSAALLALGAGLYLLTVENMKRTEDIFVTIGIVQQKPVATRECKVWDAEKNEYVSRGATQEYGAVVPVDALYFEGADYIRPPVRRPYYGTYNFDWKVHMEYSTGTLIGQWREDLPILELEPLEDCIPDHPVKMKIIRELYGRNGNDGRQIGEWETLWFCDHYNPNPQPLYAGKTYVMELARKGGHAELPEFTLEFFPNLFENNIREHRSSTRNGVFPITSTQYSSSGERIPDSFTMNTPWDEVTEGFYDTPRGRRWLEYAEAMYRAEYTIPVVPTDSTELLMSFYNGNSNIIEGRDITNEEYTAGQRVCLISQEFAKRNGFSVGNNLMLPLYYADYRDSAGKDFSPGDHLIGIPNHLLNAQGECYEVFEENEYIIVGIYSEINKPTRSTGYDMAANAVVIPAASVENSDENNILDYGPMMGYNTVFQIPNGIISQFMEAWEKQGISDLEITFYDRGYTQLKEGMERIRNIALAILGAGALIAFLILLFFCQMFIGKQKKRTAIERSLGMNKTKCTISLLSGILAVALAGSIAGSFIGYFMTGSAMRLFAWRTQTKTYSTQYSSWADAADATMELQLDASSADPMVCTLTGAFVVILSAGIALVGIRSNLKSEPLKLLSMRDT